MSRAYDKIMGMKAPGFSGLKASTPKLSAGSVVCLRAGGYMFDVASSTEEALRIIEPIARANRGEKFYIAVITAVISEELPPLSVELLGAETGQSTQSVATEVHSTVDFQEIRPSQYAPGCELDLE